MNWPIMTKIHLYTVEKKEQRALLGSKPASFNRLSSACCLFYTLWDEKAEEPRTQSKPSSTSSGRVCRNYVSCANTQEHIHTHTHTLNAGQHVL